MDSSLKSRLWRIVTRPCKTQSSSYGLAVIAALLRLVVFRAPNRTIAASGKQWLLTSSAPSYAKRFEIGVLDSTRIVSSLKSNHGPKEGRQVIRRKYPLALSGTSDTDYNHDLHADELLSLRGSSIVFVLFFGQRLFSNQHPTRRIQGPWAPLLLHSIHSNQRHQLVSW